MADIQQLYRSLFATPELLPWQLDIPQSRLLLARIDEQQYRQAAFLDQRLNKNGLLQAFWAPINTLLSDAASNPLPAPQAAHFIFHVGHCGSTLVSKLLGHFSALLPVREPLSLRQLASAQRTLGCNESFISDQHWLEVLSLLLRLLGRSYLPMQHALVKASSSCGPLLLPILRSDSRHRAILLYTDLQVYLANVLRPQSRDALYNFSQERIVDLKQIAGDRTPYLYELTAARLGAMNWCATVAQFIAAQQDSQLNGQTLLVNFDKVLQAREAHMTEMLAFLGVDTTKNEIEGLWSGTDYLRTYAKDTSFAYTPEMRKADLSQSMQTHAGEIDDACRWLLDWTSGVGSLAPISQLVESQI